MELNDILKNKFTIINNKINNVDIKNVNKNILLCDKILSNLDEIESFIDDIENENDLNEDYINSEIIDRIDNYNKSQKFANDFYPLFYILYNNYINMNSYSLDDYLCDVNETVINNIKININKNKILKEIIIFLMENNIKFYVIYNNNFYTKDKNSLLLEVMNIRIKVINNLIFKLLKFSDKNEKFSVIKGDILLLMKNLDNFDYKKSLIENNYNLLNVKNNNPLYIDYIATYNNN